MEKFKNVDKLVSQLKPSNPVYCIRGETLKKASKYFQKNFKGKILYAVKTNPNKFVLKTLYESGIKNFDIASIKEIKTIKESNTFHPLLKKSNFFGSPAKRIIISITKNTVIE